MAASTRTRQSGPTTELALILLPLLLAPRKIAIPIIATITHCIHSPSNMARMAIQPQRAGPPEPSRMGRVPFKPASAT